jgi:hypothetical protein
MLSRSSVNASSRRDPHSVPIASQPLNPRKPSASANTTTTSNTTHSMHLAATFTQQHIGRTSPDAPRSGYYRHDPYSWDCYAVSSSPTPPPPPPHEERIPRGRSGSDVDAPPPGTCHSSLWGAVSFVPYPTEEFYPRAESARPGNGALVRIFIGQLPYQATDMQVDWLCDTFGDGSVVRYQERIMKRQESGERLPTGCIHALATEEDAAALIEGLHKRTLVDDTGVWYACTPTEVSALREYTERLKREPRLRVHGRPYDSVVVQYAASAHVPVKHRYLLASSIVSRPTSREPEVEGTAPPSYDAALAVLPPSYAVSVAPPPPYGHTRHDFADVYPPAAFGSYDDLSVYDEPPPYDMCE